MKMKSVTRAGRALLPACLVLFVFWSGALQLSGNPVGGAVVQGNATFNSSASQLTIQTSDRAQINWSSFNIGVGETTTFIQPSSSSVVWNKINDVNPSQILGNLNANGYVVLQNSSGFYIGGQAAITAHGLVMTTSPTPAPDLSSSGAWQFNAPPPTASIINYGQIGQPNGDKNGQMFLIAADVQNHGTISAPEGDIGLYAGKEVLLSSRPDGRGYSARVTLPQGSVDNQGQLIADAGTIALRAQVVNQGGLVQANSVRQANGLIELVASDSVNLDASSVVSAQGDSSAGAKSPGGFVVVNSENTFSDQAGSKIIASGSAGGANGFVQVFGNGTTADTIQSTINGASATSFSTQGHLLLNTYDLNLSSDPTDTSTTSPTLNVADLAHYSKISLFARHDINLNTIWSLADSSDTEASLSLEAANNINLWDGSGLLAGRNWNLNLTAGTELTSAADMQDGADRIFLQGMALIQAQNGYINLTAGNEIFVDDGSRDDSMTSFDPSMQTGNGITTAAGGSINATAIYGDVHTGGNPFAYKFDSTKPYYSVSLDPGALGGISTAAGGNVNISAGGNIFSYLPTSRYPYDAGSGAFGPETANVTINAGGSVYGHFVVANGNGTVQAGQDAGSKNNTLAFALSLATGSWNVAAPQGSIYLQEVRNPNGVFNVGYNATDPSRHYFDYSPDASVSLTAGNAVEITGAGLARPELGSFPNIFPPSLNIVAGTGGVTLDNDITLFPSALGELNVATAGNFVGNATPYGNRPVLMMSASNSRNWFDQSDFAIGDHGAVAYELNNPNPVRISAVGDMGYVTLRTTKETQIWVGGNMNNCGFSGENLHPGDVTSIQVLGQIFNQNRYTLTTLTSPIVGADPFNPTVWAAVLWLAVDPSKLTVPANITTPADLKQYASSIGLLNTAPGQTQGFLYDPATLQFGYVGRMDPRLRTLLEGPLVVVRYGADKLPVVQNGRIQTDTLSFVPKDKLDYLYTQSQQVPKDPSILGYHIGGPGLLQIKAGSMELGASDGIISYGAYDTSSGGLYPTLAQLGLPGANIEVDLAGNLSMFTSRICSRAGGDINVTSDGSIDLGLQAVGSTDNAGGGGAYGIYTIGHSDVSVTARGDINVNGSRIAAFSGGNVSVESLEGTVYAGIGGNTIVQIWKQMIDPQTGLPTDIPISLFGSGIVATSMEPKNRGPGETALPGNITVLTPQGDIISDKAGILQMAIGGTLEPGPSITLVAGTPPSGTSPGHSGNIDLGQSGVIGGAVSLQAQGDIKGLVISWQSAIINAAQSFSGTLLSAGTANVSAGGTVSGTVIGISGASVSGGSITANVMSQNASVNGSAGQSTFGNSAPATAASQSAAQQATTDAKQQLAKDIAQTQDDDKKKGAQGPTLVRRTGRVTVILPPNS
jgi:filamentous hemagglutinin family protein